MYTCIKVIINYSAMEANVAARLLMVVFTIRNRTNGDKRHTADSLKTTREVQKRLTSYQTVNFTDILLLLCELSIIEAKFIKEIVPANGNKSFKNDYGTAWCYVMNHLFRLPV